MKYSEYRPDIDGLRALAVLSVVLFHAFPHKLTGGFIGVDIFFVISGYLISNIIINGINNGNFDYYDFYNRRVRRIFPSLFLVLTSCLIFGWVALFPYEYEQLGKHITAGSLFSSNLILWGEAGYFDNSADTKPLLHLWSLGVEEQFYILYPALLIFLVRNKINLFTALTSILIASFIYNIFQAHNNPVEDFYSPITRFWELLSGGLLSLCYFNKIKFNPTILERNLISITGAFLILAGLFYTNKNMLFPGYFAIFPVLGSVMIISAGQDAWINKFILSRKILVWFGLISYPLYLWHWPLFSFAHIIEGAPAKGSLRNQLILMSVLLAWITYKFVEFPIRNNRNSKKTVVSIFIATCTAGVLGLAVYLNAGFTSRTSPDFERISEALGDWEFPRGLTATQVDELMIYSNNMKEPEVVFLGDSHIQQYSPRIVELTARNLSKTVTFITGSGCLTVPHVFERKHPHCEKVLTVFNNYLNSHSTITDVVIGGDFNDYLIFNSIKSKAPAEYEYYFQKNGKITKLNNNESRDLVLDEFAIFTKNLSKKYNVHVLLDNPLSENFSPAAMINASGNRRQIPIPKDFAFSRITFPRNSEEIRLEQEMANKLRSAGVNLINQGNIICPNNSCFNLDEKGQPIYKDNSHIRPFFVIEKMDVLDHIVTH